ncbi:MAG: hypothetical protein KDD44_04675 [Bdellovibrionales bacterium]|nr:hypothetical protein [Bdellovibrionales bacterium]
MTSASLTIERQPGLFRRSGVSFRLLLQAADTSTPLSPGAFLRALSHESSAHESTEQLAGLLHLPCKVASADDAYLINMRGRPVENNTSRSGSPPEEELCYVGAHIPALSEHDRGQDTSFSLHSVFSDYVGERDIRHRLLPRARGALKELPGLCADDIHRLAPLLITVVRLGAEVYRVRDRGFTFGTVPSITERLYVKVSAQQAEVFFEIDTASRPIASARNLSPRLGKIAAALDRSLGIPNLTEKLDEQLRAWNGSKTQAILSQKA